MRISLRLLAVVSGLLVQTSLASTQERPSDTLLTVNHYLDYETVGDPKISPDGARLIYTRRWVDKVNDSWETALWIMNADGSENRFLTKGASPIWSPDGTRIAYLADGEPKGAQVFVRWMNAEGATSQVTRLTDSPGDIKWSPDGRWISFSSFVPKADVWPIDLPAAPPGAKWTPPPRYVNTLHYRADRRGFLERGYTHLFVVPADGGTPRALTSGEWNAGARFDGMGGSVGYSWIPDGTAIVFDGLMEPDWDTRYRDSDVYLVNLTAGVPKKLTSQRGSWTSPVVSPDGQWVALAGHPFTKQTYKTSELYLMRIDGSGLKKISGTFDRDVGELTWAKDGSGIYLTAEDKGTRNVHFVTTDGRERNVTSGGHMLSLGSVSTLGVAAIVRTSAKAPPDIWRVDLTKAMQMTQLTRVNEDMLARITLGDVEEIWYTSTGGAKVQGWVVKPPGFDRSKKYPLLMEIHGGPHGMYNGSFNYMFQNFAANGYVVLYTNPRGSTGYGTDFGNAINLRYPGVDYEDLMAGVDTVIGRGYVDDKNMFVGGCSGGGVLSSWVIGHTTRFAGAAVRCPVMNWMSFAGTSDVPLFTHNFFEKPYWDDPKPWLEQSSLMYVGKVQTPTVIMTGELDLRTPMAQSEEYYAALKMRGIPTALLRFQSEFHGTSSKPSNFMRTQLYMMSWYKQHARKTAM